MSNEFLLLISEEMKSLAKEGGGEDGHKRADELLLDTIRALAWELDRQGGDWGTVQTIIKAWNDVDPKWYS